MHIQKLPRSRSGLLLPALALAFTLVLPIACSGANDGAAPEAAGVVQGDLVAMLPASATTVGYLDVDTLRSSQLYMLAEEDDTLDINPDEAFSELIEATGIDPRTDLHRIAFASTAAVGSEGVEAGESAMIALASYDRDKLMATLEKAETFEHEGRTLYRMKDIEVGDGGDEAAGDAEPETAAEDADAEEGVLAILDEQTLVIGQEKAVIDILGVIGGAPSARANEQLMGLLQDVDPSSEMWVVSARDGLLGELKPSEGMPMPQIPVDKVNAIIFSARLATGLDLTLRGRTGAEADAKLLGDSLNGMLAFGKMMLQSNQPEVFAILDRGITAGSSGYDVTIKAALSIDDLRALRDFAKNAMSEEGTAEREG